VIQHKAQIGKKPGYRDGGEKKKKRVYAGGKAFLEKKVQEKRRKGKNKTGSSLKFPAVTISTVQGSLHGGQEGGEEKNKKWAKGKKKVHKTEQPRNGALKAIETEKIK